MKALAAAYPERTSPAEWRNGDWALQVYGQWFYYAEGRLLPEGLRNQAADYDRQPFYAYPADLPAWTAPSAEYSARMREMMAVSAEHPAKRSQHFYDALYRSGTREEAWDRVKQIFLFGHPVVVHYSILEELSLAEARVIEEARTNAEVQRWIDGIQSVDGWNWRNIAATESRSYHAYGAAVDFIPTLTRGLATYWQWTAEYNSEWWAVPYSQRLHPPTAVIKAFEAYGFVWGGKWLYYDTMHFEYRPELLIYNQIPLRGEY